MDYSTLSQPWQEDQVRSQRLPMRSNSRYFFAHHAENWELATYTQKGEGKKKDIIIPMLLPQLSTIREEPGVNSVRVSGGRVDSSILKARLLERGWIILEASKHDYMRVYPAHNGKYHSSKWTKLENLAGRIIQTFDQDEFKDWRRELMLRGDIQCPHPAMIQLMLIDHSRKLSKLEQNQHIPETAARLKSEQMRYKLIQRAIDRVSKMREKAYEL